MNISPKTRTRLVNATWIFIISTLMGLVFFSQGWITAMKEKPFHPKEQLTWAMTGWYLWGLLFPLLHHVSQRFPFDKARWKKNLLVHLGIAFSVAFFHAVFQVKFNDWLPYVPAEERKSMFNGFFVGMVMWRMLIYSAVISVSHAIEYYRKFREAELQGTRIEARILRAQMEALKMQLNPDFVFETLRSITDFMHRNLATADKMIARLGDFLRLTLDTSGTSRVPLRKELEFVRCYLEIQKLRLQKNPQVQFQIDPEGLDFQVPNLILHSLIQEAMERRQNAQDFDALLDVRVQTDPDCLKIEVTDALKDGAIPGRQNLHERLQQVYGSGFRLLSADFEGGRKTIAEIPQIEEAQVESDIIDAPEPSEERAAELEWLHRTNVPEEAPKPERSSLWLTFFVSAGIFTIVGLFFMLRETLVRLVNKEYVDFAEQFTYFGMWYLWAIATPYIIYFSKKFPLERKDLAKNLLLHIANSGFVLITMAFVDLCIWYMTKPQTDAFWTFIFKTFRFSDFSVDVLMYWTIVAVAYAARYYREYRRGEIRAHKLRAQLARAQLQALKMQLHPHFLFNTLNSISELMQEDLEIAEKMMSHLERFLLLTIRNSEAQEVPFEMELEFLKCYLEIEHVRFQDRLSVHMDIEPQTMDVQVPNLLLQPIVENAIRHGIANRSSAGHIDIRAVRTDGRLQVRVQDDGPGLPESRPANGRKGLGLSNTRERLQQIYGRRYRFDLENAPEGGLVVTLEIPAGKRA